MSEKMINLNLTLDEIKLLRDLTLSGFVALKNKELKPAYKNNKYIERQMDKIDKVYEKIVCATNGAA